MNTELLIQILEEEGISVQEAAGGRELLLVCPLCSREPPKLYISADTGLWVCHRGCAKGNLVNLLTTIADKTLNEAYLLSRTILGSTGTRSLPSTTKQPPPSRAELPSGFILDDGTGRAAMYFKSRGINRRRVTELGVGYCLTGYWRHRVIIPVYVEGELLTFVGRTWLLGEEEKKVIMPAGSQSSRALFGYDRLTGEGTDAVVVTEGVFDTMRLWQYGYQNTVATLGAHLTQMQQVLLKKKGFTCVYLLRDGDQVGREAAIKEAQSLKANMFKVFIALLPPNLDPDQASPSQITKALDEAKEVEVQLGTEVLRGVL